MDFKGTKKAVLTIRVEDIPFAIPVSKVQLIKAIKAGGGNTENSIGDANYPAYFSNKV